MKLKLASDLSLPLDAVTQTFLVVGKRGSGKSNTAARLTEQFIRAKLPVVVLDVTDTWWGLKASHDGGQGLPVYVFGGSHADLPLEAGGGALIADVLCEHRMPMILSVKHLSGRERSAFMVAFAQTLFQKWGGGPLHVVLEEAHELAPQMAGSRSQNTDNEAAMLSAFKRLWKLGRASGIGGTAVTQRPASLSKDITTQSEILIAHRTIGPQDVKAVGEWVKYHGEHLDMLADLPSLPTGEAFIWAPEFPEGEPLGLRRTSILRRETFDSASTPKVGEKRVEPKELAPVDLERLQRQMSATIEKAKADDPKELRRQIAELKKQVAQPAPQANPKTEPIRQVKPVLTDADRALLEKLGLRFDALSVAKRGADFLVGLKAFHLSLDEYAQRLINVLAAEDAKFLAALESKGFQKILDKLGTLKSEVRSNTVAGRRADSQMRTPAAVVPRRSGVPAAPGNSDHILGRAERSILTAAVQRLPKSSSRAQLSVLSGYSITSSSFSNALGALRTRGLLTGIGDDNRATDAGVAALGDFNPLPTGDALVQYWMGQLGKAEAALLHVFVEHYPHDVDKDTLSAESGYSLTSSSFSNALGKLRTLELVTGLRASEELFA